MLSIKKQNLINLIVYFFIISNILDPSGKIGLKYFSFFLLLFGSFLKPSKLKSLGLPSLTDSCGKPFLSIRALAHSMSLIEVFPIKKDD